VFASKSQADDIVARKDFWWHQRFELSPGVWTPGASDIDWLLQTAGLPQDLSGKSVLDIGTTNGGAAFAAERRGAHPVVAVDICDEDQFGFRTIKEALGSKVEFRKASIYDLPRTLNMQFDIVLFLGVIYHLRHPLLALDNVRLLTRETAWIESAVADDLLGDRATDPVTYFFRLDGYKSDGSNWFVPSTACLVDWCRSSGLDPIRVLSWPSEDPTRSVVEVRPVEPEFIKCSYEVPVSVVVRSEEPA